MAEWLMAGVWRYVFRLPPMISRRRVTELADRIRAEVSTLPTRHRDVHHHVVTELPRHGRPLSPDAVAEELGLPSEEVHAILSDLERRKLFVVRNADGAVAWAYPVTTDVTPHRIRFRSGETLFAA